jgi:hypothetical protein
VVDPARERTLAELQALDLSISSVKQEQAQYSLSGPIAMTAAGFGVAVVFGSVSFVEWALAESIEHGDCHYYETHNGFDSSCDLNNDNRIDGDDEHRARVLARTFGALSGAAGVVGILGTVFLMKRMEQRKAYKPRLIELNAHRQQLLQQLRFGGSYGGPTGGLRLSLSGRF